MKVRLVTRVNPPFTTQDRLLSVFTALSEKQIPSISLASQAQFTR
jgi:hypothetical protein